MSFLSKFVQGLSKKGGTNLLNKKGFDQRFVAPSVDLVSLSNKKKFGTLGSDSGSSKFISSTKKSSIILMPKGLGVSTFSTLKKSTPILNVSGISATATNMGTNKNMNSAPSILERNRYEDPSPLNVQFWEDETPAIPLESFQIDAQKGGYDWSKIFIRDENGTLVPDRNHPDTIRLHEHMKEIFNRVGAVHIVNTGFTSHEEFNAAVKVLHENHMQYEGGANLRAPLEGNVYDTGAPREADLHYHHEMAYVSESTQWLAFGALEATSNPLKGATFISENNKATELLMDTELGQKLKDKGLCYVRKLPDQKYFLDNNLDTSIVYNYWQTSTMSEDPEEAQAIMEKKGLHVEWEDSPIFGRYMVTKYYTSCFEYDPYTDKNTLYASIADDYSWFDSWPGVMSLPHWERPLKLNFGDDTIMTRDEKQLWTDIYDKCGVPILWKKGDLAIICNHRTAHGRPMYDLGDGEKRELGVILGEPFDRIGEKEGKW